MTTVAVPKNDGSVISDHNLLKEFRPGSEEAAEELYRRYVQRLSSLARKQIGTDLTKRFDEDDVLQSVFRVFFNKARAGFYNVPEDGDLWPLLVAMAVNKVRARSAYHRRNAAIPSGSITRVAGKALKNWIGSRRKPRSSSGVPARRGARTIARGASPGHPVAD